MSEWFKEHAWKACVGETLPWVRIPLSPPNFASLRLAARVVFRLAAALAASAPNPRCWTAGRFASFSGASRLPVGGGFVVSAPNPTLSAKICLLVSIACSLKAFSACNSVSVPLMALLGSLRGRTNQRDLLQRVL